MRRGAAEEPSPTSSYPASLGTEDAHLQHAQQEHFALSIEHGEGDVRTQERQPLHGLLAKIGLALQPAVGVEAAGSRVERLTREQGGGLQYNERRLSMLPARSRPARRPFAHSTRRGAVGGVQSQHPRTATRSTHLAQHPPC